MTENFQLADEFIISDLETLKVLADPMRLSIIEYLIKPATVKQIAQKIERPPTKLYYHFNLLEKHDLIQTVDTRIVSGIVEKHYQAVARSYRVQDGLLSPGSEAAEENLDLMLSSMWEDTRSDLQASLKAGVASPGEDVPMHRRLMVTQGRMALKPEQADIFYDKLMALLQEFDHHSEDDNPTDEHQTFRIFMMLYPSITEHGVRGYSWEQCWEDYRLALGQNIRQFESYDE